MWEFHRIKTDYVLLENSIFFNESVRSLIVIQRPTQQVNGFLPRRHFNFSLVKFEPKPTPTLLNTILAKGLRPRSLEIKFKLGGFNRG